MFTRRVLISTCALVLVASPALPQTSSQQAPSSGQPSSSQPSASQQSGSAPQRVLSMRQVLRAWGLDRPTRDLQFRKGEATNERATFTDLVIKGDNGSTDTLDNLVITRSSVPGPTLGQFTIVADKISSADGTRVGRFTITGFRGGANLLASFKAASNLQNMSSRSNAVRQSSTPAFADTISMTDVSTSITDKDETYTIRFGQLDFTNVSFDTELRNFDVVTVGNIVFDSKDSALKLDTVQLSGVSLDQLATLGEDGAEAFKRFDILSFVLGRFSMDGLTWTFKAASNKAPPVNTIKWDSFRVENIKDGFMGQFNLSGLKLNGGIGGSAFDIGLNRFAMGGLNMRYFSELGSGIGKAMASIAPKTSTSTPSSQGTTSSPAPAATALTPPRPRMVLKDLMKGGPLDSGVGSVDFVGLTATAAGFNFSLDRVGLTQIRNSDNIITRTELVPTTMRLSWPTETTGSANAFAGMLKTLGTDHIALRFSGAATYAPLTDRVVVENYETEIVDWGKFKMNFAMSGINKLMSDVTMEELYIAALPTGTGTSNTKPAEQLSKMFKIYKDVTLDSARFEIFDLGGLDTAARISLAMAPGRSPANAPITAQQKRTIRDTWAATLRNTSGDKTKPAIERQGGIAIARWLETGGSVVIEANPPTPIAFSALENAATMAPAIWGFKVSNRPASAPAAR